MLFSKENSDFLLKIIIKINPSVISCMRVVWRVLHKRTIAIALLSHLSQVRVSQLSPRTTTFCIWLPFPRMEVVVRRSSALWPLALSLLHLLVPVTYCEPWMLIRSWSSRLPDSVWEFYAGGQRSCDWGKEFFAAFFPVAVLWALSIWTLWFNLKCLTPSVICSGVLNVKSDTIFMEEMRESF